VLALPVGHGRAELVPLGTLDAHEVVKDVIPERLAHELAALEPVDGLAEGPRQTFDALGGKLALALPEGVARGLLRQGKLLLDALEACGQRDRKRKVGVCRGVCAAQLDAGGDVLARLVRGKPHERGTVLATPGGVVGHLTAADEALVGVDGGIGDQGELGCVLEQARHVVLADLGKMRGVIVLRRPEEVLAVMVEKRLVQEHRGARGPRDGLGHERSEHVLRGSLLLDDETSSHDVVGAAHGLGKAKLHAVLRGTGGVEGILDRYGHLLEQKRGGAAQVARGIHGREVEVSRGVQRHRAEVVVKVEVLDLGTDVVDVALLVGLLEDAPEDTARGSLEGLARRRLDVAEHACHATFARTPRKELEGVRHGKGEHVRLLERGKAVNRRAVKADTLLERLLELLRRYRKRLEVAEHVGEPESDEADVSLLDGA